MLARHLLPFLLAATGCARTVVPEWPDGDAAPTDAVVLPDVFGPPVDAAVPRRTTWTPGWDRFDEPFDLGASDVTFTVSPGTLTARYSLGGAVPGRRYAFGLHLFRDPATPCAPSFGPYPNTGCNSATRQGTTHGYAAYDADHVTIAANGTASATIHYAPIPRGQYVLEFHTRVDCAGFPGCDVVLQSPGPWGTGTVTVDIP